VCNYPNIPRGSTTNQTFSYLNGCHSLDDFWIRLCLICITSYERKLAAILKQSANYASIGVLFISASKEGERD
jgi:hypothetical protein